MNPVQVETEPRAQLDAGDFLLRRFVESDAPAFAAAARESAASLVRWMPWADADFSESQALDWFAICNDGWASGTSYQFGIFLADAVSFIGGAGLNQFNQVNGFCNLGYWVRDSARRQGAASAATKALAKFAFETLQLSRVEIVIAEGNEASLGAARKAGASYECLARNRLRLHGQAVAAHMLVLLPER
ncbi:GNAT family N-acetyltransferase [Massilia terrae]|uniref:GNAT family N-acetyltransferase n=1 Tax=Massilia terrae TaxID=1811224 RepID=A0ABT2D3W1_9BURK|nr:GNAT family N-acetyltransferase [Massilia terrae]MCS0660901.1 GNAT family N-acetyltransferase [Massilia terrae]